EWDDTQQVGRARPANEGNFVNQPSNAIDNEGVNLLNEETRQTTDSISALATRTDVANVVDTSIANVDSAAEATASSNLDEEHVNNVPQSLTDDRKSDNSVSSTPEDIVHVKEITAVDFVGSGSLINVDIPSFQNPVVHVGTKKVIESPPSTPARSQCVGNDSANIHSENRELKTNPGKEFVVKSANDSTSAATKKPANKKGKRKFVPLTYDMREEIEDPSHKCRLPKIRSNMSWAEMAKKIAPPSIAEQFSGKDTTVTTLNLPRINNNVPLVNPSLAKPSLSKAALPSLPPLPKKRYQTNATVPHQAATKIQETEHGVNGLTAAEFFKLWKSTKLSRCGLVNPKYHCFMLAMLQCLRAETP
ncbi:hypothetical protein HDU76_010906, partial [Blyttiomyces sp. JEL0837]